jgi:hypothetical protein
MSNIKLSIQALQKQHPNHRGTQRVSAKPDLPHGRAFCATNGAFPSFAFPHIDPHPRSTAHPRSGLALPRVPERHTT